MTGFHQTFTEAERKDRLVTALRSHAMDVAAHCIACDPANKAVYLARLDDRMRPVLPAAAPNIVFADAGSR